MVRFALTVAIIGIGILLIPDWRESFRVPTNTEWLYLFAIACSTGLFAMYIYYRGLKTTPVHISAILELTWPIIAVMIDYFVYGTVFTVSQYIAIATLMGSMYFVTQLNKGKNMKNVAKTEKSL